MRNNVAHTLRSVFLHIIFSNMSVNISQIEYFDKLILCQLGGSPGQIHWLQYSGLFKLELNPSW